jgi:predicted metal-binding membrane protein
MLTTAAVAGPAQFAWMAILTIAVMAEKLSLKPKRAAHWVAALLAAAAAGSLLGSISP